MDPSLAASIATVASAASTALIMFASYHLPSGRNEHDDEARHDREAE